jgi:hypothetical protein
MTSFLQELISVLGVILFFALIAILLYRRGVLPLISNEESDKEIRDYGKQHLLHHLIFSGITNEQIERFLIHFSEDPHFEDDWISQYLLTLPEKDRAEAKKRLGVVES